MAWTFSRAIASSGRGFSAKRRTAMQRKRQRDYVLADLHREDHFLNSDDAVVLSPAEWSQRMIVLKLKLDQLGAI